MLALAAVAGFILSNSPLSTIYFSVLETPIAFSIGQWEVLNKSLLLLINDGLMALFFLFIGLELKREVLVGELSDIRQAMLPIFAAIGGMVLPATAYLALNSQGAAAGGWGIPMATDIAFALGILAVLGSRVPASLKVMLAAIAIVDDLGAILVIALFYTAQLDVQSLAISFAFLGLCFAANRSGVMRLSVYLLLGVPVWYFMLKSGVHATIAGVLLATTIPLAAKKKARAKLISDIFSRRASPLDSPAVFLEKSLVHWIGFLVIPVFAFANAGVPLGSISMGSVSLGIILGLVLGKPLGIVGFAYLAKVLGIGQLPPRCTWWQVTGIGCLAGIGFTMALFIGSLAFTSPALNDEAKLAILVGSAISGSLGVGILLRSGRRAP